MRGRVTPQQTSAVKELYALVQEAERNEDPSFNELERRAVAERIVKGHHNRELTSVKGKNRPLAAIFKEGIVKVKSAVYATPVEVEGCQYTVVVGPEHELEELIEEVTFSLMGQKIECMRTYRPAYERGR
jgi:hypothetical protein